MRGRDLAEEGGSVDHLESRYFAWQGPSRRAAAMERSGSHRKDIPFSDSDLSAMCQRVLRDSGFRNPPVDLPRLMRGLGARLLERPISCPGRLETTPYGYDVIVDPRQSFESRRFTIAHELGHVLIRENRLPSVKFPEDDSRAHPLIERVANRIASELLMPRDSFLRDLLIAGMTSPALNSIRSAYRTSLSATLQRILEVTAAVSFSLWTEPLASRDPPSRKPLLIHSWSLGRYRRLTAGASSSVVSPDIVAASLKPGTETAFARSLRFRVEGYPSNLVGVGVNMTRTRGVAALARRFWPLLGSGDVVSCEPDECAFAGLLLLDPRVAKDWERVCQALRHTGPKNARQTGLDEVGFATIDPPAFAQVSSGSSPL